MNIVDEIALRASAERPALVADGATLTYGELLERVSVVANWLSRCAGYRDASPPRVGLTCPNGVDYIVLALAILKSGGCLVPIADELTQPEREELITRTRLHGLVEVGNEPSQRDLCGNMERSTNATWLLLNREPFPDEDDFSELGPAFIRFSSGTTGRSKGVILSHRRLRERIVGANAGLEITSADRVIWMLPMAHHFAVSIVLYLFHGACTILTRSHLGAGILQVAEANKATVIYGAPFHFALLAADFGDFKWPSLRLAVVTASALPEKTGRDFIERFGTPLVQGLGIIEVGLPILNLGGAREFPTSIGRPLPAFDVELRDDEGRSVQPGKIGEIWIRGPGLFDAYLSPWQPAHEVCVNGWFATGDLAVTDASGRIFLRGRKKSVLNIGGMKVFPEEIEKIIEGHPAVFRCRVRGIPHAILESLPVAEIVLHEDATLTARELITWTRLSLAGYKVPSRVKFVSQIPLTASGKVKRV